MLRFRCKYGAMVDGDLSDYHMKCVHGDLK